MFFRISKNIFFSLITCFSLEIGQIQESFAGRSYEGDNTAAEYAKAPYSSHPDDFLSAKGIKYLLSTLPTPPSGKALDFGCGPGTLSVLYSQLGYKVTGVDISPAMIEEGIKAFPFIDFQVISKGPLPFKDEEFDAAFSSYVFLEMDKPEDIINSLKEIKRVLKKGAPLVVVVRPENMYKYKKYSFVASRTNFSINDTLVSGGRVRIHDKSLNLDFEDFFWSEEDYRNFFKAAGFQTVTLHSPLGSKEDELELGIKWISETEVSPVAVYLVQ